jgi:hypothetical protein
MKYRFSLSGRSLETEDGCSSSLWDELSLSSMGLSLSLRPSLLLRHQEAGEAGEVGAGLGVKPALDFEGGEAVDGVAGHRFANLP